MSYKILQHFEGLTRRQIVLSLVFLGAAVFAFLAAKYGEQMSKIGYVILFIELIIIVTITWGMAGHTVMKALFGVSVGLSLLIYIAQSYCETPPSMHTGDTALMSLVGFGVIYIGYEFLNTLRKEVVARLKMLKEINDKKNPWIMTIPYGLFTGLFTWQVGQVLMPIINSLCVYHK